MQVCSGIQSDVSALWQVGGDKMPWESDLNLLQRLDVGLGSQSPPLLFGGTARLATDTQVALDCLDKACELNALLCNHRQYNSLVSDFR